MRAWLGLSEREKSKPEVPVLSASRCAGRHFSDGKKNNKTIFRCWAVGKPTRKWELSIIPIMSNTTTFSGLSGSDFDALACISFRFLRCKITVVLGLRCKYSLIWFCCGPLHEHIYLLSYSPATCGTVEIYNMGTNWNCLSVCVCVALPYCVPVVTHMSSCYLQKAKMKMMYTVCSAVE